MGKEEIEQRLKELEEELYQANREFMAIEDTIDGIQGDIEYYERLLKEITE